MSSDEEKMEEGEKKEGEDTEFDEDEDEVRSIAFYLSLKCILKAHKHLILTTSLLYYNDYPTGVNWHYFYFLFSVGSRGGICCRR